MDWRAELQRPIFLDDQGHAVSLAQALTLPKSYVEERLASVKRSSLLPGKRHGLRAGEITELQDDEIDFELDSMNKVLGTHTNLIPLQSGVAGPRIFYGTRFANQALPVKNAEAPLVQSLIDGDKDGQSFDDYLGRYAGARFARKNGTVKKVDPDGIDLEYEDGERERVDLYNKFPFNRKTALHNTSMVKPGDPVQARQVLAKSNYTDDKGTLAMGLNARVGLVPYQGKSMDDAIVVSESFAKKLTSNHLYGYDTDFKRGVKGGKAHYTGIFANKFTRDQLGNIDDDGVIKPGTVLNPGDPIILATRPRVVSSASAQLGLLSKHMRNARTDAATLWEHHTPGVVTDVQKTRGGVKVNIETDVPTESGDKIVFRSGQKGTISEVIPDDRMPRTVDGKPLEVLLNPLGIPSRVNNSMIYELLLGKAARKAGQPYRLATFNKPGEKWYDLVEAELAKHGLTPEEEVFDPALGRKLENPITVGDAYLLKLHHTSASKVSARNTGAYSADQQPLHGGGDAGQAKRMSGLETHSLLSAGAYNVLRDTATVRGQRNDDFWRMVRQGYEPKEPGSPFVYEKFKALLTGSGYLARKLPGGKERLTFFADKDLDKVNPVEVKNGDIVDIATMEPVKGGLFDPAITGGSKWGYIKLPFSVPNPASEEVIVKLLGLTHKQYRDIIAGRAELPAHLAIPQTPR